MLGPVVINQERGVTVKIQREGRFHYSELQRALEMFWYEILVVMVVVRNHSRAQNYHPLSGFEAVVREMET